MTKKDDEQVFVINRTPPSFPPDELGDEDIEIVDHIDFPEDEITGRFSRAELDELRHLSSITPRPADQISTVPPPPDFLDAAPLKIEARTDYLEDGFYEVESDPFKFEHKYWCQYKSRGFDKSIQNGCSCLNPTPKFKTMDERAMNEIEDARVFVLADKPSLSRPRAPTLVLPPVQPQRVRTQQEEEDARTIAEIDRVIAELDDLEKP